MKAMAQTLYSSHMHIVFSTKNRFNFIRPEIEDELFGYIGGVVRNYKGVLLKAGGTSNVFVGFHPTLLYLSLSGTLVH